MLALRVFVAALGVACTTALAAPPAATESAPARPEYETPFGFRVLYRFSWGVAPRATGAAPFGGLIQASDGNFYGETIYDGPYGGGAIFRMKPGGAVTPVRSYPGGQPQSTLTEGSDHKLYGTDGAGHIFTLSADGTYTLLHELAFGDPNGFFLQSSLVEAGDGNFYGTATNGGPGNRGTVYRISPTGEFALLHAFSGRDGSNPWPGLVLGIDGALYGVTGRGAGVLYRIRVDGSFKALHRFGGREGSGPTGLLQGRDGWLYGSTSSGAGNGSGAIFRFSTDGRMEVMHSFTCLIDGCGVRPPMQADDGNFYGVTSGGGKYGKGTVYRMTPQGQVASLHSFDGSDGSFPSARLVQGSDGNLYGTAYSGGIGDAGTIFAIGLK